ncbi:MAG TPA: hypothetical protein VG826_06630 [Pirellulales bacterium]|nr:hypothetical protein [Pirellulales bacterium]
MQRSITTVIFVLGLVATTARLRAENAGPARKPVEGTLTIGSHTFKLLYAVAYQTTFGDETCTSVLASDRKIPMDRIQATLKKDNGSDENVSLDQPYVIITFRPSGELLGCRASGEGGSFSRSGSSLTGTLTLEGGRAKGEANLAPREDATIKTALTLRWDVVLSAESAPKPAVRPAGVVKPSVSGTFKGNGKQAKLAFVSARPGEPFDDRPSILIVLTERDHSKDPKPDIRAAFGDYGSALIVSTFEDGKIFGCQVAHAAHGKMPFSALGSMRTAAFEIEDGRVEGEFVTDGEQSFFDKTWEVNLKFVAPYSPPAKAPLLAAKPRSGEQPTKTNPAKTTDRGPGGSNKPAANTAKSLKVKDLALPKDATDTVYKKLVGQITFNSATGHQALAAEFSKKLAAQGWKSDDDDLIAAKSAILNRTLGEATLTIFVKPAPKGSTVTIMTEGLDWEEE